MSQGAVIAIALLLEALLIVSIVAGVLGWRLRRRRSAANDGAGDLRGHFEAEIDALGEGTADDSGALQRRQRVLQGELKALDLDDSEARQNHFAALYAESNDESARLRRLLQREAKRVGELLEIRDGLRELKVGYERLQRIFTRLVDPELGAEERERIAETFRGQETAWAGQLDQLLARLESATEDLEPADDGTPAEGAATRTDARSLADGQSEALEALRERLAAGDGTDPEALRAEIEGIERRGRELSTCLQVLEDENNYLYQQLCEARDGDSAPAAADDRPAGPRPDADELEQALAMKDREIEELKQRLYDSMDSLSGEEGATEQGRRD